MTPLRGEGWQKKSPRLTGQRDTHSTDSFIIVTNGEKTEKYYLNGLKRSLPDDRKNKVSIDFLFEKKPQLFVERAIDQARKNANISPLFNPHMWIVFDRDQVQSFDEIIQKAENEEIDVAWSNPCLEVWFWAYFENVPFVEDSQTCINLFKDVFFKNTRMEYKKNDKDIYDHLCKFGDEDRAFKWAETNRKRFQKELPKSQWSSSTKLDILVKKIQGV